MNPRTRVIALSISAAFLAIAVAQALGLFGGGSPSIASPAPFPLVLLAWALARASVWAVPAITGILFAVWSVHLLKPSALVVPPRTLVVFAVVFLSSSAWYAISWPVALEFEGPRHTGFCIAFSAGLACAALVMLLRARARSSWPLSLVAHWLLFYWAFSYAVPWFGETP